MHVMWILLMLRADIAKNTIACFCDKHVGTVIGGMRELINPCTSLRHPQFPYDIAPVGTP